MARKETVKISLPRNFAPLCILEILKEHSDSKHKLTQAQIAKYLEDDYSIVIQRQAIGRTLDILRENFNVDIVRERKGCYFDDATFMDYELELMIHSIFTCKYIPEKYTKDLIKKLASLTNEYFDPKIKFTEATDHLSKSENQSIFSNVEYIDSAIEKKKQIQFNYNKYGVDKKLHKTASHTVTPIRMLVHSGRYYLKGYNEKYKNVVNYRMDHITDMVVLKEKATPLKQIKGFEAGITNEKHMGTNLPYMYTDEEKRITFLVRDDVIDQVVDWLGDAVVFDQKPMPDGRYKALVLTSPTAMLFFAMQYTDEIEVIAPKSLRDDITAMVARAAKKYK